MIVTQLPQGQGESGWAFHSRIVPELAVVHRDRHAGIKRMLAQEIPAVIALVEQWSSARELEITRGVMPKDLDYRPIYTEAQVFLAGGGEGHSFFPTLDAQAAKLKIERDVLARSIAEEHFRLKHTLANVESETQEWVTRTKQIESRGDHEALDKLWKELNDDYARIRIILLSLSA